MNIDKAGSGWSPLRQNHKIDIPAVTVGVSEGFRVIVQLFGRVDGALFHFDDSANFLLSGLFVTREREFVDMIEGPLLDPDGDKKRPVLSLPPDLLHFHVDVAVVLVKLFYGIEVLLQLDLVQPSRFVDESDHRLTASLHLLAQDSLAEMLVAFKMNPADRSLHTLVDRVNNARRPTTLVDRLDTEIHCDVGETPALIPVDDLLPRFLQIVLVDRCVESYSDFLAKLLRADAVRTVDNQFAQHLPRLHGHNHFDAVRFRLRKNSHILNHAGLVKAANVVFDRRIGIRLTNCRPDLCENHFLRHRRRTGVLHVDRTYGRCFLLR